MDVFKGLVEQSDCVVQALSFCDHMAYAMRPYSEFVDLVSGSEIELHFADVRIGSVVIPL